MIKEYIAYLRDNPEGYWFKRKLYGWGWTPAKPQGWAIIVMFVGFILWNMHRLVAQSEPTDAEMFLFLWQTGLAVLVLLFICYKKGEKPRWQWGVPPRDSSLH